MRIIVGISGASNSLLGYELLRTLHRQPDMEIHLVVTAGAVTTFGYETDLTMDEVYAQADYVHNDHNMAASISSGSFKTDGMVVAPCSMKTVSAIANGYSGNLLVRAADVCLKERRKVVLVTRETPLSGVHLKNMKEAHDQGCIILPPVLTLYNRADTVEKQIDHIIGKILMQFGLASDRFVPWHEPEKLQKRGKDDYSVIR